MGEDPLLSFFLAELPELSIRYGHMASINLMVYSNLIVPLIHLLPSLVPKPQSITSSFTISFVLFITPYEPPPSAYNYTSSPTGLELVKVFVSDPAELRVLSGIGIKVPSIYPTSFSPPPPRTPTGSSATLSPTTPNPQIKAIAETIGRNTI